MEDTPPAEVSNSTVQFIGPDQAQTDLIAAMCAARLEFGAIERSREGQYGTQRFKYAPLGVLTEATAKPLARQGVLVMQFVTSIPGDVTRDRLTTWFAGHGARIAWSLDFARKEAREEGSTRSFEFIKEYGKLVTYLCRYQYKTSLVLDSEPDDDDAASAPEPRREPRREAPRAEPKPEPKRAPKPAERPQEAAGTIPAPAAPPPAAEAPPRKSFGDDETRDAVVGKTYVDRPLIPGAIEPDSIPAQGEAVNDGPMDEDMRQQLKTLRQTLDWSVIEFSNICMEQWKIDPASIAGSMRTARRVMELMQHALLDRQQAGAA